jgi:uncharacterized membrane protein YtjA (UPF0391 family)
MRKSNWHQILIDNETVVREFSNVVITNRRLIIKKPLSDVLLDSITSIGLESRTNPKLLGYGVIFLISAIIQQVLEMTPLAMYLAFIPGIGLLKMVMIILFLVMLVLYYVTARNVLVIYTPRLIEISDDDAYEIAKLIRSSRYEEPESNISNEEEEQ